MLNSVYVTQTVSTVAALSVRTRSRVQISHFTPFAKRLSSSRSVMAPADVECVCVCVNCYTFTVVWEMELKGLETAGVWSELVPNDFTEQDDGDVVLDLKRKQKYKNIHL